MTMYQAIAYLASSGFSKQQITDIIQAIIAEVLYVQENEAILRAASQIDAYYTLKESEE